MIKNGDQSINNGKPWTTNNRKNGAGLPYVEKPQEPSSSFASMAPMRLRRIAGS